MRLSHEVVVTAGVEAVSWPGVGQFDAVAWYPAVCGVLNWIESSGVPASLICGVISLQ